MDKEDLAIIDLALLWHPYGGPPDEEILVNFGMSELRFRSRVVEILADRGTVVDRPLRQHARTTLRSYLDIGRSASLARAAMSSRPATSDARPAAELRARPAAVPDARPAAELPARPAAELHTRPAAVAEKGGPAA